MNLLNPDPLQAFRDRLRRGLNSDAYKATVANPAQQDQVFSLLFMLWQQSGLLYPEFNKEVIRATNLNSSGSTRIAQLVTYDNRNLQLTYIDYMPPQAPTPLTQHNPSLIVPLPNRPLPPVTAANPLTSMNTPQSTAPSMIPATTLTTIRQPSPQIQPEPIILPAPTQTIFPSSPARQYSASNKPATSTDQDLAMVVSARKSASPGQLSTSMGSASSRMSSVGSMTSSPGNSLPGSPMQAPVQTVGQTTPEQAAYIRMLLRKAPNSPVSTRTFYAVRRLMADLRQNYPYLQLKDVADNGDCFFEALFMGFNYAVAGNGFNGQIPPKAAKFIRQQVSDYINGKTMIRGRLPSTNIEKIRRTLGRGGFEDFKNYVHEDAEEAMANGRVPIWGSVKDAGMIMMDIYAASSPFNIKEISETYISEDLTGAALTAEDNRVYGDVTHTPPGGDYAKATAVICNIPGHYFGVVYVGPYQVPPSMDTDPALNY